MSGEDLFVVLMVTGLLMLIGSVAIAAMVLNFFSYSGSDKMIELMDEQ